MFKYNPNKNSRVEGSAGAGLDIPVHDHVTNSYNGSGQLTSVVYRQGGATGSIVATLTLTYDANSNLSTVSRS